VCAFSEPEDALTNRGSSLGRRLYVRRYCLLFVR